MLLTVHAAADADIKGDFDGQIGRYDAVFAISKAVEDDIRKRTERIRPKTVENGIKTANIRFEPRISDGTFRIVQIARLNHCFKGQDVLLRALARLRDEPEGDIIRLDFVGEGPSRPYLERMARDLGLERLVSFRGALPRSTIYHELCTYDLLVHASRSEGFGLSIVEAMAASVPVLISDINGPKQVIASGRFGFLFRSADDADCARQIEHIRRMRMEHTLTLTQQVSAARAHVLERYDIGRTAAEYVREYTNALGRGDCRNGKKKAAVSDC
jgi:glycosyltransferase involved in cell wall biosynthesis